ncbi:MAG: septum formation initiator family protein [Acidimicrobiales bacterium]
MTARAAAPRRSSGRSSSGRPSLPRSVSLLAISLALAAVVVLFVAVYPTQALLDQQSESKETAADLRSIEEENLRLEQRVTELQTDAAIEQLARNEYGLVYPGEEAYAILPGDGPTYPRLWPFTQLGGAAEPS